MPANGPGVRADTGVETEEMTARMVRVGGPVVMAVTMALAGCSQGTAVSGRESRAAAAAAAQKFQRAVLDEEWEDACEARTERLRAGTVAECVKETGTPLLLDYSDALISTGEPFEVEASGIHPAGVGLRVSVDIWPEAPGLQSHTAIRLVPAENGTWLVDQIVHLEDETKETDTQAVRAALQRR